MKLNKKSIVLGYNGDRDSQITGILLSKQGYSVTGVYYYINPEKIFEFPKAVISKFTKNQDEVSIKAEEIGINLTLIDITDEFIDKVVGYVLSAKVSFSYVNYAHLLTNFILNKLTESFDIVATGHYLKILKLAHSTEVLMHTDITLDQSWMFSGLNLDDLKNLMLPLGDLALRERDKIVKDYKISSIENTTFETLDILEFVPESLVKNINLEDVSFSNISFRLDDYFRDIENSFIKLDETYKYVSTSSYECSGSNLKTESFPQNLFAKLSNSKELFPLKLFYYTLSRFKIEFTSDIDVVLYCGQNISIYSSEHQNAKLLGFGIVSKPL